MQADKLRELLADAERCSANLKHSSTDFNARALEVAAAKLVYLHGADLHDLLAIAEAAEDLRADAMRWRHVREVFAEEMLDTLFGIDSAPDTDPTYQLDAACDADIESDAALSTVAPVREGT